jgi:hypothetical protein
MLRGRKISSDVQWIIIRLSSLLRKEDIAMYTGISVRSIVEILRHFNTHGTVEDSEQERKERKWLLRDLDVEV